MAFLVRRKADEVVAKELVGEAEVVEREKR